MFNLSEAERRQLLWNLRFHWQRAGVKVELRTYGKMGRMPVRRNVGPVR